MKSASAIRSHYLLRALWIAAIALYIMHLNHAGALHYYLAPHIQKLLLLCPVPLLFIAFGMIWHAITGSSSAVCDCGHPLPAGVLKAIGMYGLLSVPLLFGLLPNQALASDMAAKKGMIFSLADPGLRRKAEAASTPVLAWAQAPDQPAPGSPEPIFAAGDGIGAEFAGLAQRLYALPVIEVQTSIFSETVGAIDMYKQPFRNKKITLQGFVYRENGMAADTFAVSRFLVMCCTADATPFGVMVRGAGASEFAGDTWVEVNGTVQTAMINGVETLQIQADQIRAIGQPDSPYIYTSPDSVAAFDELQLN